MYKRIRCISAILFVILYLVKMVEPVFPFLEYCIDYSYISTTLCKNKDKPAMHCNGKCYLSKMIRKQLQREQQRSDAVPEIDFNKYPVVSLDRAISGLFMVMGHESLEHCADIREMHSQKHIRDVFRPPITC